LSLNGLTGLTERELDEARLLLGAYFCAGIGYVVSATFIVAIVDRSPNLTGYGDLVFFVIGLGVAVGALVQDLIARRMGEINALILAAVLQVTGILLPMVGGGLVSALAGALLFGLTTIGLVSLAVHFGGYHAGLYLAATAMAVGTLLLLWLRSVDARERASVSAKGSAASAAT
jgi:Uncharacterised MFS-type transporter YbfB